MKGTYKIIKKRVIESVPIDIPYIEKIGDEGDNFNEVYNEFLGLYNESQVSINSYIRKIEELVRGTLIDNLNNWTE